MSNFYVPCGSQTLIYFWHGPRLGWEIQPISPASLEKRQFCPGWFSELDGQKYIKLVKEIVPWL